MAMQVLPASDAAELRRHLDAAPDLVFAAFADPALVRRWLTPNPEVKLEVLSFDFHVGGAYRFAYHVPGGAIMHVNACFARSSRRCRSSSPGTSSRRMSTRACSPKCKSRSRRTATAH